MIVPSPESRKSAREIRHVENDDVPADKVKKSFRHQQLAFEKRIAEVPLFRLQELELILMKF